jgi:NTP pyrophosphatase (non-canonical NTP hydrolase)
MGPDFNNALSNTARAMQLANDTYKELSISKNNLKSKIEMYQELEAKVLVWAKEKGILDKATPLAQCDKTFEEVEELCEALEYQSINIESFTNSKDKEVNTKEEIKDALGDILVTIIIQAEMQGLKLEDCLQSAYDVISKRTGVMRNGQFHKDND